MTPRVSVDVISLVISYLGILEAKSHTAFLISITLTYHGADSMLIQGMKLYPINFIAPGAIIGENTVYVATLYFSERTPRNNFTLIVLTFFRNVILE